MSCEPQVGGHCVEPCQRQLHKQCKWVQYAAHQICTPAAAVCDRRRGPSKSFGQSGAMLLKRRIKMGLALGKQARPAEAGVEE